MATATIREMHTTHGVGDAIYVEVKAEYPGTSEVTTVGFQGSRQGTPGPVVMIVGGVQAPRFSDFVAQPERFGAIFGEKWAEAFFA